MQSITTSVLSRILLSALFALSFTMSVCAQTTVNAPSTARTGTAPSKSQTSAASTKTKVACIGDSLTRGYLLEDAQLLTPQAQNAFLLTLEEPPPYVLFLLLTENALALLETVRSRAPVRRMELLTAEQIAGALTERFPEASALKRSSPEEFRELIAAAGGCIGPAIELLDSKKRAPVLADRAQVRRFLSLAETGRNGTDAIALLGSLGQKRDELTSRMNLCLVALRDLLLLKKTETAPLCFFAEREEALALSCRFPTQGLLRLCGAVDTAIDRLRANGNVRLILTLLGTESGLLPL